MGKDLGHLIAPTKAPAKVAPTPAKTPEPSPQPKPAEVKPSVKPPGKPWMEGFWEGFFKQHAHEEQHEPIKLKRLEPQLKQDMVETQEEAQPLSLQELPAKTDIQSVPVAVEPWQGGTAIDTNGDGIPDVRYRQRSN